MTRRTPFTAGVLLSGLAALGWLMVPGCGSGSSKPDGGAGAGGHAGGGHGGGHAGAGGGLAGAAGTAGAGGGSAGAGAADAGGNGGAGGGSADAGVAGAGGNGGAAGGSAGSTGTAAAGGNGRAGTSGTAGAGGNGGTGPCTASFGAGNRILYTFGDGTLDGWMDDKPDAQVDAITWSASTGHSCPGAVQLSVPGASGATADLTDIFFPGANWTGFSKLHAWVRVQTTHYAGSTLYLYVQANSFADQVADYRELTGSAFTDGAFHEMVVDLTTFPAAQDLADVDKIDLTVSQPTTDAGTLAPLTVSIDDIWLEASGASDAAARD